MVQTGTANIRKDDIPTSVRPPDLSRFYSFQFGISFSLWRIRCFIALSKTTCDSIYVGRPVALVKRKKPSTKGAGARSAGRKLEMVNPDPRTNCRCGGKRFGGTDGFSLAEITVVLAIGIILTAMAIPQVQSAIYNYRLRGAVSMATWAIQSTRYQALMEAYPYQVVFTSANGSYQIQNSPTANGTYTNVGTAVPLSGSVIALSADTTLNFKPNGSVLATAGALNFTLTYQGVCQKVTVTNYGNVSITPANPQASCP
jgi:type II secretory pathway pseudopilin PulG